MDSIEDVDKFSTSLATIFGESNDTHEIFSPYLQLDNQCGCWQSFQECFIQVSQQKAMFKAMSVESIEPQHGGGRQHSRCTEEELGDPQQYWMEL